MRNLQSIETILSNSLDATSNYLSSKSISGRFKLERFALYTLNPFTSIPAIILPSKASRWCAYSLILAGTYGVNSSALGNSYNQNSFEKLLLVTPYAQFYASPNKKKDN